MKCQTINCDNEATHEFYDMHHGFAITVHCKIHVEILNGLSELNNRCAIVKEIPTPNL